METVTQRSFGARAEDYEGREVLIISTTSLATFKRCPKAYQLQYVDNWETPTTRDAVNDGVAFHAFAEEYAHQRRGTSMAEPPPENDAMYDVFAAWAEHRAAAVFDGKDILVVEEPIYTPFGSFTVDGREIYVVVRTTPDLVTRNPETGWLTVVDYKTFSAAPSLDLDFNSQAALNMIASNSTFNAGGKVRFVHEYVRRVPPGTKNSKGVWAPAECYIQKEIVWNAEEMGVVARESLAVIERIVQMTYEQKHGDGIKAKWYRVDLGGNSPYTCGTCFVNGLCKEELFNGEIREDSLAATQSRKRDALALPPREAS